MDSLKAKLSLPAMADPAERTKVFFFYDLHFQSLRDHMVKSMEQSGALADLMPLEDVLEDLGGNNRSLAWRHEDRLIREMRRKLI